MTVLEAIERHCASFAWCAIGTDSPIGAVPDITTIHQVGLIGSYTPRILRSVMLDCEVSVFTQAGDHHPPIRWQVMISVFTSAQPRSQREVWFLGNSVTVSQSGWPIAPVIV